MSTKDREKIGEEWVAAMPAIYHQIQKALNDPESSFIEIADIIGGDVSLTSRLLKICNSSFYGLSSNVETITHALNIVGTQQLSDLVLATTVTSQFKGISKELVDMESFWQHSIGCGIAARNIGVYMNEPNAERFYIAGMLHDIGSLVIYQKMPNKAKLALALAKSGGEHLFDVEQKKLGFDHTKVGQALLKAWKLPDSLVDGVGYHHEPLKSGKNPIEPAVVHIADSLAYEMQLGTGGEPGIPEIDPKAWGVIGLAETDLTSIREMVEEQFEEAIAMFTKT